MRPSYRVVFPVLCIEDYAPHIHKVSMMEGELYHEDHLFDEIETHRAFYQMGADIRGCARFAEVVDQFSAIFGALGSGTGGIDYKSKQDYLVLNSVFGGIFSNFNPYNDTIPDLVRFAVLLDVIDGVVEHKPSLGRIAVDIGTTGKTVLVKDALASAHVMIDQDNKALGNLVLHQDSERTLAVIANLHDSGTWSWNQVYSDVTYVPRGLIHDYILTSFRLSMKNFLLSLFENSYYNETMFSYTSRFEVKMVSGVFHSLDKDQILNYRYSRNHALSGYLALTDLHELLLLDEMNRIPEDVFDRLYPGSLKQNARQIVAESAITTMKRICGE